MPALEKVWQYDDNHAVPVAASVLDAAAYLCWYIKASICSQLAMLAQDGTAIAIGAAVGKWQVDGSSDAVTAGMDAVDRTGNAVYDFTKWVRAAEGNPHTWLVVSNATNGWKICINFAGNGDHNCDFILSKNAFVGGSVNNRPVAANESSAFTLANYRQLVEANILNIGPSKTHCRLGTDGRFHVLRSKNGSGHFEFGISGQIASEADAANLYNFYLGTDWNSGADGPWSLAATNAGYANWLGRAHGGLQPSGLMPLFLGCNNVVLFNALQADQANAKFRDTPMYFAVYNVNNGEFVGRFADWKWTSTSNATLVQGASAPAGGPAVLMKVGHTFMPARTDPLL